MLCQGLSHVTSAYLYMFFHLILEIRGIAGIIPFYRYGALRFKRLDHRLYFPRLYSQKTVKSGCLLRDFFYIVPHIEHVVSEDINVFGEKVIFASIVLLLSHIE